VKSRISPPSIAELTNFFLGVLLRGSHRDWTGGIGWRRDGQATFSFFLEDFEPLGNAFPLEHRVSVIAFLGVLSHPGKNVLLHN